jgi:hypothetical protein
MRWTIGVMMLALAFLIGASVSAPVALAAEGSDACCDVGCDACGDPCNSGTCCGGLVADLELTFLRYFQEGGVTDAIGAPVETDYEFAPRIVLGYVAGNGLGFRTRYWELDTAAVSLAGNPCGANAYNLDWELFQEYCLGCDTTIELSLGLRYAELWLDSTDLVTDPQNPLLGIHSFSGFGGTMAAQVNRAVLRGNVYARARMSLLMGDAAERAIDLNTGLVFRSVADDCTAVQTELALGYEICRCTSLGIVTLRSGVEWQNWANMAIGGVPFGQPIDTPLIGGLGVGDQMEDAGFAGFVVGFGLER